MPDRVYASKSHESITVGATAIGITSALITALTTQNAQAFCTLETAQIRYTTDGTTPTSTVGHLLEVGQSLVLEGLPDITAFRAIRTSGSGTLKVTLKTG